MNLQNYYQILVEKLTGWLEAFVAALPNLVVALIVVAAFTVLSRIVVPFIRKMMSRLTQSQALIALVATTAKYVVLACGLFIALGVLGLQKTVLSLLAGAGIAGLALGFAFQDLAANFISGVLIAIRRPFAIGDVIETSDYMGTVHEVNLRNSTIRTFSGQHVILPNRELFEKPLVNYSREGRRRVELSVGVAYESDLSRVTEIARQAIEGLEGLAPDESVTVTAREFGGSSIDFTVYYWIPYPGDVSYLDAVHRGVVALKRAFDEQEIEIPFPIRTLDFSWTKEQAAHLQMSGTEDLARAG